MSIVNPPWSLVLSACLLVLMGVIPSYWTIKFLLDFALVLVVLSSVLVN